MSSATLRTPCFLIDRDQLYKDMKSFVDDASSVYSNIIVSYSFKTNSYPVVIDTAKQAGLWAEVVSEDEYYLAKKHGYNDQIIYNGPVKSFRTFREALLRGAVVNIDSMREVEWLEKMDSSPIYNIGLRINFSLNTYCTELIDKEILSRFGFFSEDQQLKLVIDRIRKLKNVNIVGFHMHRTGNSRSAEVYRAITEAAICLAERYDITLRYIDVGGGFKLGVTEDMTTIKYIQAIATQIRKMNKSDVTVIMEPGNSLVYPSIDYITQIIDIKEMGNIAFATLDGSRIHVDPLFRRSEYLGIDIKSENVENSAIYSKMYLCGFTCKESDRIALLENVCVSTGDLIWIKKVGAYTMSLIPEFISTFPNVYVNENNEIYLHHKKELFRDY